MEGLFRQFFSLKSNVMIIGNKIFLPVYVCWRMVQVCHLYVYPAGNPATPLRYEISKAASNSDHASTARPMALWLQTRMIKCIALKKLHNGSTERYHRER
ncbi:hypothetical protein XENOCAPTIV_006210 [Xenoophorus captivus]|uniref:Uncharacterized protein n=1 Tax=Xenoophorus captivus TaxID=1517983 RepID=A0ABV0RQR2_9TELE